MSQRTSDLEEFLDKRPFKYENKFCKRDTSCHFGLP
jgi:hypothetical protein